MWRPGLEANYQLVEREELPLDLLAPKLTSLRERQDRLVALREEVFRLEADTEDMESRCSALTEDYDPEAAAREWRK